MKAPVGLSSDRTVLRQQDGGASPRQVRVCGAKQNNESPSGAFKRPNGLAAARWRGLAPTSSSLPGKQATENHTKNEEAAMVLYFTGTGNSRYLARRIAEGLEMPLYDLNAGIKAGDTAPVHWPARDWQRSWQSRGLRRKGGSQRPKLPCSW